MTKLNKIITTLRKYKASNVAIAILIVLAIAFAGLTYYAINGHEQVAGPDPSLIIKLVLCDLIILLVLAVLVTRKIFKNLIYKNKDEVGGRLRNRIIVMFSLVAAAPTIVIAIFSAYFFNFGLQSWFNQRVHNILNYSVSLSEAYNADFTFQLKQAALATADELTYLSYDLAHEPRMFHNMLNAQAEVRALSEAMVFQNSSRAILAQTSMSFSLAFSTIPAHLLARADAGEVVEIKSDPARVRMLVKLKEYNDTYLLVGRLIDPKLVDYSSKISYAIDDYGRLNSHLLSLQIQFSMAFIAAALFLLLVSTAGGMVFAGQIIRPIRRLLIATEKLQHGDLSVHVSEDGPKDDELLVLSRAFNKMVDQLDRQQRDLVIAQRALAWSDVARMVAHEIKNPLTPIQLASNMLAKKFENEVVDKEAFNKYIKTILRHTSDIGTILNEFVNFAKIPTPKFITIDLVAFIQEFVESRRLLNDKMSYIFNTPLKELKFICDQVQMTQIMINLFKNAEDAIEDAKKAGVITVSLYTEGDKVILAVSDNGAGFPLDAITKAAEPYFTTRAKGTGLGLAIVQKIVGDHNGSLTIDNIPDSGAEIRLTFAPIKLKNTLT